MKKLLITIGLLLLPVTAIAVTKVNVASTPKGSSLQNGLVGWWTFDGGVATANGVAVDMSGNGNNGNLVSISTSTFYTAGKIGQAFNFDGVNDVVQVSDSASLSPTRVTVAFWALKLAPTFTAFVGKRNNSSSNYSFRTEIDGGNNLAFGVSVNGTASTNALLAGGLLRGTWNHVVGTFDGTTVALYLNGVLRSTAALSGNLFDSTVNLRLGSEQITGPNFFNGYLDDVRIYNRALTAAEVRQLYEQSKYVYNPTYGKTVYKSGI